MFKTQYYVLNIIVEYNNDSKSSNQLGTKSIYLMSRYDKFSGATSAKSRIFEKNEKNHKCIILTFLTKKIHLRSVLIEIEQILPKKCQNFKF